MGRNNWWRVAATAAMATAALSGCAGSALFPAKATLPATLEEAYAEVQGKDVAATDVASLSGPTRAFLTGFDEAAARPTPPTRPTEPRPSALATERFALPDLAMSTRPADGTACALIATQVGGAQAECAAKGDSALADELPEGVPAGSYVVGKAYGDGRIILLNQPGEGGEMWDAAMHERGHLLAAWLCGRADCLNAKIQARGYRDSSSYLGSLTEGFAQSWAQCHGARTRADYTIVKCPDVAAVVAAAEEEKAAAKRDYDAAKKTYDDAMANYQQKVREYDERGRQVEVLKRFGSKVTAAASATSR